MSENHAKGLLPTFYRRLLDLSGPEEADRVLGRVLELLAGLTGAERAYLEILDLGDELRLGYSAAGEPLEAIRARVAPEIVRRVGVGERAVLCVPLEPIDGALYLERAAPFSAADEEHAGLCARQIGERLLARHDRVERLNLRRAMRQFQRRHVRAALQRTGWNVTEAARQLAVARSYLYKLIAAHELRGAEE